MDQNLEMIVCNEIDAAIRGRDADRLQSILILEPPFPPVYQQLIASLRRSFPAEDEGSETKLYHLIRDAVKETGDTDDEQGRPVQSWNLMVLFLVGWMTFIRDLDIENLLITYDGLSTLMQKVNSALQHPTKGILLLPTVMGYAKTIVRVATGLDKHPELIEHLISASDEGYREWFRERAANVIRSTFIVCLNDRNTAPGGLKNGKPDGKKVAIYKFALMCIRLLFEVTNYRGCETIFKNISGYSPPLKAYPAAERVTYLYYLGRYHFQNTNYFQAQLALQGAYDDCPVDPSCIKQRRRILIYLLTANLILGRFPTEEVYSRPEAYGFKPVFYPITQAIRNGNLEAFRRIFDLDLTHESAPFLLNYRVFYQIGNYCEVYVWRTLFRKVFLLSGQQGATERSAPTLDLHDVLAAFLYCEKKLRMSAAMSKADGGPGRRHISFVFQDFPATDAYVDPDFGGLGLKPRNSLPTIENIECRCSSMITQGFLNGYISKKSKRFAIQGSRRAGSAVKAGFPSPWTVISQANLERGKGQVEGWVTELRTQGGQVMRLQNVSPAGG